MAAHTLHLVPLFIWTPSAQALKSTATPRFSLPVTMKMSIVAIALALVYFVSFVAAANQPSVPTPDERMQLAKDLKELLSKNPSSVDPAVAAMSTEDLFGMLSGLISNPSIISNAAGLISSATRGDISGLASHATGLLGAALPVAASALAPGGAAGAAGGLGGLGGLAGAAGAMPLAAAPAS